VRMALRSVAGDARQFYMLEYTAVLHSESTVVTEEHSASICWVEEGTKQTTNRALGPDGGDILLRTLDKLMTSVRGTQTLR
jgi:hypothetical protein